MNTDNKGGEEMNNQKKLLTILGHDKGLLGMFSGIILSAIGLISVAVTACVWYL